jgi:hypothetical protein
MPSLHHITAQGSSAMRLILALTAALTTTAVEADPTVFGLTLGKTTESEFVKQYPANLLGTNTYSNGHVYEVAPANIDFADLRKATVTFDDKGLLVVVSTTFAQGKFDYLNQTLGKKYKLVEKKVPFVGDKDVTYKDGNSKIQLVSPHMSFEMSLVYFTLEFERNYLKIAREEKSRKMAKEASQL